MEASNLFRQRVQSKDYTQQHEKNIETIKKDRSKIKNAISEINNKLEGIHSRIEEAENLICDWEDNVENNTQAQQQEERN